MMVSIHAATAMVRRVAPIVAPDCANIAMSLSEGRPEAGGCPTNKRSNTQPDRPRTGTSQAVLERLWRLTGSPRLPQCDFARRAYVRDSSDVPDNSPTYASA